MFVSTNCYSVVECSLFHNKENSRLVEELNGVKENVAKKVGLVNFHYYEVSTINFAWASLICIRKVDQN